MANDVDGLVIEIESGASEVGSQLDALTFKLEALKRTVGSSTPLKTFSRNYQSLINTIATAPGFDTVKLEGLFAFTQAINQLSSTSSSVRTFAKNYQAFANSFNALDLDASKIADFNSFIQVMSNMNNVKISPTIAKQLDNLNFVMQNIDEEAVKNFNSVISTLQNLTSISEVKISSSIPNQLGKIAELGKNIQGYDFTKLNELTMAISNLGTLSGVSGEQVQALTTSVKSLSNATRTATTRGRTFNTVLANIRTRTLLLVRATQTIRRATTQALGVYGDYVETLNLFKMAMGEAGEEAYEFAEKAQGLLGIDLTQWMKAQGVFNALASGFGVAGDRAAIMSKNLTQLAYDISSFYNIDVDTAVEKVRSGFSGQIRPVRDLGYDLSQARLEAIALSLGIDKTVKSMTQAEKSQLRYIALMTQLTQVQGDLSRTLDSPINQMRILQAQLQQMYRSIGMTLLPLLNRILPYLNAILRVIKMIADEIAAMFGYTLPKISGGDWSSSVVMGAEDIEDELEDATGAAEKLKNTLASFDQINLISSKDSGSGAGGSALSDIGAFDFELPEYDFLGDVNENKAQEIAESMMRSIRPFVELLKDTIKFVVDHIDIIKTLITALAVTTIGKTLLGNILGVFTKTDEQMKALQGKLKGLALVTIGFQFAYEGGKDLGKGNYVQGILQSAFGTGIAALGGNMLFGPAGLVMGVAASLIITFKGYLDGKAEALRKECHDIFFAIRDDAYTLDQVKDSWEKFCSSLTNPEVIEKMNVADELEKNVAGIGKTIGELRTQYLTGNVIASSYAQNLIELYGELETAVAEHMKGVDEAIIASLQGPFGDYMRSRGYDVQQYIDAITSSTDNAQKRLEQNRLKLQEYNHYIEEGISVDHYRKKIDEILQENEEIYKSMGEVENATTTVFDVFKNININMDDLQPFKDAMASIQETYSTTIEDINKELELYRKETNKVINDPEATEAQKQHARNALALAEEFARNQKQSVTDAYLDLVNSFEEQAVFNWVKVYDMEGLDAANQALKGVMGELDQVFEEAYGTAQQTRMENDFTNLMGLTNKYSNLVKSYSVANGKVPKSFRDSAKDMYGSFVDIAMKFSGKTDYMIGAVGKMADAGKTDWDRYSYYVALNSDKINSKLPEIPNSMQKNLLKTTGLLDQNKGTFALKGGLLMGAITDVFKNDRTLGTNVRTLLENTSSVIGGRTVRDKFRTDTDLLLGVMSDTLRDPMGRVRNAIRDSLSGNESEVEGIGKKLGLGIAKGIDSTNADAENSVSKLTKRMGKPFNQFGSDLYTYMNAMTAGIVAIWNSIEISTGKASLSKIAVPKWSMKGYATGGFPDTADFFYANENGVPEFVGTMGGRPAVANNAEITKGVADAVYKAIKDTGIASDVKKIASKDGKVVFAPSEEAGRVMSQSVNMYNGTGGRY